MLEIEGVSIRFGDNPEAVSDTTFTVGDGDRLAVVGETGSGKSVLLLAALGLLPASARVTGSIRLNGRELLGCRGAGDSNRIRGKEIAYIPQGSGNGLNPLYTVGHQLCEAIRKYQPCTRKEALVQAAALLESFGLEHGVALCRSYPFQLSGGMRQRVLIAMGIAAGADLVLADEPTKGLDRRRIALVEDAFQRLGERTLLCVTHDLRFAHAISSRVVVMYASRADRERRQPLLFAEPLHPYSRAMLEALPENGLHANMGFAPPRQDVDAQSVCHFYGRCPWRSERCRKAPPLMTVGKRKVRCWKYAD